MINYIISDIHFSKTKNLTSITNPMDEFISAVKSDSGAKRVIISGDFFDHQFHNSDPEYKVAVKYLKSISDICDEMIVLYGTKSHDRSNYEPILPFFEEHVHFFNVLEVFESTVDGTKFLLIPEEYPDNFSEYYKDLIMVDENEYDYVIGHGNIIGAKMNEYVKIDNFRLGKRAFNKEDLGKIAHEVFFGHIHLRQNLLENVQYVGSMNKTGFGEMAETKGYWVFDHVNNKKEYVVLESVHSYNDVHYSEKESIDFTSDSVHVRIVIDAEVDEETLDFARQHGVKVKDSGRNAKAMAGLKSNSNLKYENLDESMAMIDQIKMAMNADSKISKVLKESILVEIDKYFNK